MSKNAYLLYVSNLEYQKAVLWGLMGNDLLSTQAKDKPGRDGNGSSGLTCSSAIRVSCSAT